MIFICGNGGSAANAIHMANDLILVGVPAHALTADVATLTAIANDFGYEHVFSRQLEVLGKGGKNHMLIALSGSGRSPNILQALHQGRSMGMKTVLITGQFNPDVPDSIADQVHRIGADMQAAEEAQVSIAHAMMRQLKENE